jgi:hypothetical protein
VLWVAARGGHAFFRLWRYRGRSCLDMRCIVERLRNNDWALSWRVVYPSTVGAFAVSIVPIDSHCWPSGEIFVDVCLMARSGNSSCNSTVSPESSGREGLPKEPVSCDCVTGPECLISTLVRSKARCSLDIVAHLEDNNPIWQ